MGNIFNFCEVGLKISGVSPIHSRAALLYRNTSLSAVQAATTAHHTVLFLGTTTGSLKKVRLLRDFPFVSKGPHFLGSRFALFVEAIFCLGLLMMCCLGGY